MATQFTRRDVLIGSVGAAGLVAAGTISGGVEADAQNENGERHDRSANAPSSPVAIQRCQSYEPQLVRRQMDATLDLLGGINDLVAGKTVTVKLNLTGGGGPMNDLPAVRTYQIHPNVVAALCAALAGAGAKQIILVESFWFREEVEQTLTRMKWDLPAIHAAGEHRVTFENTRNRGNWPSYSRLKVSWGGFLYPAYDVNARYEKTDVFISLAKLKDHRTAGITLAIKNLFGMPPNSLYGDDAPNEDSLHGRGAILHLGSAKVPAGVPDEVAHVKPQGQEASLWRVPRITADCLGARPVDLSIIDGVETVIGGEGPWHQGTKATAPRLLIAGRNAVCNDAVCAAVMGYDPTVEHNKFPFPGENHLRWLALAGIGTNDPKRIEVRGLSIANARHPFRQPDERGAAAVPDPSGACYYGVKTA